MWKGKIAFNPWNRKKYDRKMEKDFSKYRFAIIIKVLDYVE